jgi:DNA-binding NtrC family response regulator
MGSADIFVVDDEPLIAGTTAEILKLNGYSATAFTNPHDALAAVLRGCPRLLIVDLKMPDLSGLDLAIQIRELCAGCRILVFTGHPNTSDSFKNARERGWEFSLLYKPASPADLLHAVSKLMGSQAGPGTG